MSVVPSNFMNFNSLIESSIVDLIHIHNGLLSSFRWGSTLWYFSIFNTCRYRPSNISWAIIGNALLKVKSSMTTWIVSLVFSNGWLKCYSSLNVGNCFLGLKTLKAHILSFFHGLYCAKLMKLTTLLSLWGINIMCFLLYFSTFAYFISFSSWVH